MDRKTELTRRRAGARGRRRAPRPPGGKALQRLFAYLGQRDPALNNDDVAIVAVPRTARPSYALTREALKAKPVTAAAITRVAHKPPAARRSEQCPAFLGYAIAARPGPRVSLG